MKHPVIAITMGDPGGIGPEVIVKVLRKHPLSLKCRYVVIGASKVFSFLSRKTGLKYSFEKLPPAGELEKKKVYLWDLGDKDFCVSKEKIQNGKMAIKSVATAADLAGRGLVQGIVTAPLNKASARLAQKDFIGHTEFFAKKAGIKKFAMMFVGPKLKLTLATTHIPIKQVSKALTADSIFDKIMLTDQALRRDFGIKKPKIAVCALNPHGRECGSEEDRSIVPAVKRAQRRKVGVSGPYPADQIFHAAYAGAYDALIGMYHDQALAPFKMAHFYDGVNVTLGLPYVRTSPDHGTAYDIAYQGKADPSSMIAALRLAERLTLRRNA